jgi:NAD(P)-dependent dehydrogenase (short-subunit alcohol dehydrogenase family)
VTADIHLSHQEEPVTDQATHHGRTAVVTGAGSGIGRAIAHRAAALGMDVVLADVDPARLEAAVTDVRSQGGTAIGVVTDVSDAGAVDRLAEAAYGEFGGVDVLVNNAGVESVGYIWDLSPEVWSRVQRINADGVFHGIRSFVPRMGADPRPSHVINVASVAAVSTGTLNAAYFASKHAVLAMTECLHLEAAGRFPQLKVSVVCPGAVTTQIFADAAVVAAEGDGGASAQMLDALRGYVAHNGITPDDAARTILDHLDRDGFWIQTHPDDFAVFAGRRATMLAEQAPPPPPLM